LTEICIGLQDLELPAWITVQILDAARPWSTLPLHSKWKFWCARSNTTTRQETVKQFGKAMCGRRCWSPLWTSVNSNVYC
jgi:hypothetical protein